MTPARHDRLYLVVDEAHDAGRRAAQAVHAALAFAAVDLARRVLALSAPDASERLGAVDVLGAALWTAGQTAEAFALNEAMPALARAVGDARSEGVCQGHLGCLYAKMGRFAEAREALARRDALVRAVGDRFQLAVLLCNRSEAEFIEGDGAAAQPPLEEADGILRALGAGPDSEVGHAVAQARAKQPSSGR